MKEMTESSPRKKKKEDVKNDKITSSAMAELTSRIVHII